MTVYEGGAHAQGGHDPVEVLRSRLGVRYQAGIDEGRGEIARVLADELNIGRDEAERMTRQLIESGEIRYVTDVERDVDPNIPPTDETQSNVRHRSDDDRDHSAAGIADPALLNRTSSRDDTLNENVVVGGGGPQTTAAGINTPAAGPVAAGSSGALPGTLPINVGPGSADGMADGGGYWDFGSGAAGVRPSPTRKGQVEPLGT